MVRYFYAWTPLVIIGAVFILSAPWLGLIALTILSLVALAAFALAVVCVPYQLGRAISRRWHSRSGATPRTAAPLPLDVDARRSRPVPAGARVLLTNSSERDK